MDLSHAILHGNLDLVAQILSVTENVNYLDEYGYSPLTQAVIADSLEKVKLLLKVGADPNQKDATGRTALYWAVSNDSFELTKLLLEHKGDPNSYNISSEPILARPMMRHNESLKRLLVDYGASTQFANDYIKVKLLGHRYELIGSVDIVDTKGVFTEVDYEGFYLESSIDLIRYSLADFQHNFASRSIAPWFDAISLICNALAESQLLLKQDHYLAKEADQMRAVHQFLKQEAFILPINQEGHALSLVKHGQLLAIIDRAKDSLPNDRIPIFYINRLARITTELIFQLVYARQQVKQIHRSLKDVLSLQEIDSLPIADQQIGNCSWANIEATIPVMKFMMSFNSNSAGIDKQGLYADCLELFHRWRHWDRDRALGFVIQDFKPASPARKASIAALLACILFQHCTIEHDDSYQVARRIIPVVLTRGYEYILESYEKFYVRERPTRAGENLMAMIARYKREEM